MGGGASWSQSGGTGGFGRGEARIVPEPSASGDAVRAPVTSLTSSAVSSTATRSSSRGSLWLWRKDSVVNYPDNSTYTGQLLQGRRHGRGTLLLADGTVQEAEWKSDQRAGKGSERYADGTCFRGLYVDGLRCGYGVMSWPEGSQYAGHFDCGKANGYGTLQRTDGSLYNGTFKDDCMSGRGSMEWKDGVKYRGHFVANRREGQGVMAWTTGKWLSYDGEWKNGMQHGQGTLVDHNGLLFHGVFHWGKLVRWGSGAEHEDAMQSLVPVPTYWSNKDIFQGFNERKEVPEAFQAQIQRLLDGTFRNVRTRDWSGGRAPARLRLIKCHRVENSEMWVRHNMARDRVAGLRPTGVKAVQDMYPDPAGNEVKTQALLDSETAMHLDQRVGEHLLWHGTTPQGAIGISTNGFKLSLAGSHAGTYFGNGVYFAECSSKSDEYAREGGDLLAGIFALLLCRVICGNLFRTTRPDDVAIQGAFRSGDYDAVLGDREASAGTYREFVVYEEDLAYPEYVVLYERKYE